MKIIRQLTARTKDRAHLLVANVGLDPLVHGVITPSTSSFYLAGEARQGCPQRRSTALGDWEPPGYCQFRAQVREGERHSVQIELAAPPAADFGDLRPSVFQDFSAFRL
jgi:hypothetical protein